MRPQRPPLGQAQSYIREWGSKPRVDQHRKCVGVCPSAKAGHWETEKAMETQDKIHKRESEDLRGL